MTLTIRPWLIATVMLSLPFQMACEGEFEVDVVGGPGSRAEEPDLNSKLGDEQLTIEYIPGSKLIIQGTDAHPVSTVDPSLICSDMEFYNANGSLVWGTANCSAHFKDPNLTPENIKAGTTIAGVRGELIARPPDCSADGATGCVAVDDFPTVNKSLITAANIRSGVEIIGVTGAYPSLAHPLASATATPDLSSLGPATPAGLYEFFDSAGNRYEGTIADGSSITASTALQEFSAENTVYRACSVVGDAKLVASNIKSGVKIFGVVGNVTPSPANCGSNGSQSCVATGAYYAATSCAADGSDCYLPAYVSTTQPKKAIDYDNINTNKAAIRSSLTISGIPGTLATCDAANQSGCVATSTYKTMDLSTVNGTGLTSSNFNDTIVSAGAFEFWTAAGERHTVTGDTDLSASNVKSGVTIFGVVGGVTESPEACSSNGSQECVAGGSYFAATSCTGDDSNCFVPTYVTTDQPLKAISYDAIDSGKTSMRSSLSLSGVSGTIADCNEGDSGCFTVGPAFAAAAISGLGDKVITGQSVAAVDGTVTLPDVGKVLTGTSFGAGGTGSSGTLTLPAASHVHSSHAAYGDTSALMSPSLTLPAGGKVLTGTQYGVGGNGSTGSLTLPLASNVISGSDPYGEPGSLMTPAYSIHFPDLIVRPNAPTITATTFNIDPDQVTLTWSAVAGATGYIVLINNSQAVSWTPTDGVTYVPGAYGSDTMIYAGASTTVTYDTAITAGTTYYFAVYSYETNQVYSASPSTKTLLSCAGLVGGTWVPVPGDSVYDTSGFCVMKYIPSNVSSVPTSQTGTAPWVGINQTAAAAACSSLGLGYHLITNPQWMTVAANIANVAGNWSHGVVGSGTLSRGHSDNNPGRACAADVNDAKAWVETNCTGQTGVGLTFNQRRTQFLSNNEVVWDFGGNVWQWVDAYDPNDKPAANGWVEYSAMGAGTATWPRSAFVPRNSTQNWWGDLWNSAQSIGQIHSGANPGGGALLRGAHWGHGVDAGPFAARLNFAPSNTDADIGFRCAWQPPPLAN